MKRILSIALLAFSTLFFAGCAATGTPYAQANAAMPTLKPGEGRIYFFRSSSMFGAAMQPDIKLNGQVVGESKPGGYFYVDRPAGKYTASASTETEKTASFTLDAGETKYLRSSVTFGVVAGRVILELETPEKAKAELPELTLTTLAKK